MHTPDIGSSEVDGPNAEITRHAKLKLYSDIPYLKSETTKQKTYLPCRRLFANAVAYLPMQSLIYQPTLRGPCEFNHRGGGGGHGGGAPRFGNDHLTYLRLGHYSAGKRSALAKGLFSSSFFKEKIFLYSLIKLPVASLYQR